MKCRVCCTWSLLEGVPQVSNLLQNYKISSKRIWKSGSLVSFPIAHSRPLAAHSLTTLEIADKFKVTLVEALPSVLPSFSQSLVQVNSRSKSISF